MGRPDNKANRSPSVSIVILTFNQLNLTTKPCLESLELYTPFENLEIIIVDNASYDRTPEYLKEFASRHSNVTLKLNDINTGYAAGNNAGISLAGGDVIILLNNDVLLTPNWLETLILPFRSNPSVGLVGPVTNSAGNDQRIDLPGLVSDKNYLRAAETYTTRHSGVIRQTERLGFFCVAIHRNVISKIGLLDEDFGIGMFEDDDFCLRAIQNGFSCCVVEDCFIYHLGSVSFSKLATDTYRSLFDRNRKLFTEKHGVTWSLSNFSLHYWERFDQELKSLQKRSSDLDPEIDRIITRWEGFGHLLTQVVINEHQPQEHGGKAPASLKRSRWKSRWYYFKRNVIHGSWHLRGAYFKHIAASAVRRIRREASASIVADLEVVVDRLQRCKRGKLIVFPATVDFSFMKQRPQWLAEGLAKQDYVVVYNTRNHQTDRVRVIEETTENLFVLNEKYLGQLSSMVPHHRVLLFCIWPNNARYLDYLKPKVLLYDFLDDLSLLDLPEEEIDFLHRKLLREADVITVTSRKLKEGIDDEFQSKVSLLPNAVSQQFLDAFKEHHPTPPVLAESKGTTVIGYVGAIAPWIDFDLLTRIATSCSDYRLVLIGPIDDGVLVDVRQLEALPNVLILPAMRHADLPPFLKAFDLCIIPFKKNEVTDAISPVEVYEYFAAGKLVISTNIAECEELNLVRTVNTHSSFIEEIKAAAPKKIRQAEVQEFVSSNTWDKRVEEIVKLLDDIT